MNTIINFIVTKDEDGGFVASATNAFIVTQGEDFNNLLENIKEALGLYFDEEVSIKSPFFNLIYSDQVHA